MDHHNNVSQQEIEATLAQLNIACLHAEKNGITDICVDSHTQTIEYLEWFRVHNIPIYVDTENKCYKLSCEPGSKEKPLLIERHRIVVDGVLAYEGSVQGEDGNAAYCVFVNYLSDSRPRNVLYQMLRQEVAVGTDPESLSWTWTIQGAPYANAAEPVL